MFENQCVKRSAESYIQGNTWQNKQQFTIMNYVVKDLVNW